MDFDYGNDKKTRRLIGDDELTGTDFFTGDEVVDVDDMIDLNVPIRRPLNKDALERDKRDPAASGKESGDKGYVLGEIKNGTYITESEVLSERDARAIMELLPDEHLYMRSSADKI